MVQLNATYRSIEESLGRLLPEQTKGQLALLESLGRYSIKLSLLMQERRGAGLGVLSP